MDRRIQTFEEFCRDQDAWIARIRAQHVAAGRDCSCGHGIDEAESAARSGHALDDEYDDGVDGLDETELADQAEQIRKFTPPGRPAKLQDEARWTWGWRPVDAATDEPFEYGSTDERRYCDIDGGLLNEHGECPSGHEWV
jgi:hypothetical protein